MFRKGLRPGGLLLVDSDLVHPSDDDDVFRSVPATRTAEDLGNRMAANVVMLGYLVGATNVVSRESVENAIRSTVKAKIVDFNLKAFDLGLGLAHKDGAS